MVPIQIYFFLVFLVLVSLRPFSNMKRRLTLSPRVRLVAAVAVCLTALSVHAQSPFVKTQVAQPVRATNATINGMAVPNGNATMAWFEWGTDRNYGNTTAPQSIGNGSGVVRVSSPLTGLAEGGVYHFRLVASNSVAVVNGFDFMFTTAMKVQHWGSFNAYGATQFPNVPAGLTNLSGIACGHRHALALRNDGTVAACWLVNADYPWSNFGQTNIPPGLSNVVAVAGGYSHCLALKEDGTVVAWGKYSDATVADVPASVTNVIAVGGGDNFSAALKADGKVVAWGPDTSFCGLNNPNINSIVAISCGTEGILGLRVDGTVASWGCDRYQAPSSATNIVMVATMARWDIALRVDGTTVEFGLPLYSDVPKPANLTNAVAVLTGYGYAEALRADGTVVGWGRGWDATNIPPQLSNVVAFASGDYHRVGLAPVNLPPRTQGSAISGSINTALTVPLLMPYSYTLIFDPNGDPFSVRITSLPAKGTLYQYTGGGPGAPISAPGTVVTDPGYRVVFVPLPNDYGAPYTTFSLVANDGEFDSGAGSWTINISAPPRPTIQTLGITNGPPLGFALSFIGVSNTSYSVWYSATLDSWSNLGPATEVSPGQFSFTDYTISNAPARFYRVRFP